MLVTRPAHQAQALAARLEQAGAEPLLFPTLEIAEPEDVATLDRQLTRLADADLAIFISPNAVHATLRRTTLPATLALAAVGQGTLRALAEAGSSEVLAPTERFDSEGLLELLPAERVRGRQIVILRGGHGRELLGDTLVERGARITHIECYRRLPPRQPDPRLLARVQRGDLDMITVTSAEGLQNLCDLAGPEAAALRSVPLIVTSERQAQLARELGFHTIRVAAHTSDDALLEQLHAWRAAQNSL